MKKIYVILNVFGDYEVPIGATFDLKQAKALQKKFKKKPKISQEKWNFLLHGLDKINEDEIDSHDLATIIHEYIDSSIPMDDLIQAENFYEREYQGTLINEIDFYE